MQLYVQYIWKKKWILHIVYFASVNVYVKNTVCMQYSLKLSAKILVTNQSLWIAHSAKADSISMIRPRLSSGCKKQRTLFISLYSKYFKKIFLVLTCAYILNLFHFKKIRVLPRMLNFRSKNKKILNTNQLFVLNKIKC